MQERLITIIISCLEDRIFHLHKALNFQNPEVCYLIVHQTKKNISIPHFAVRDDIVVIHSKSRGLSKSRNIGLRNCKTKYALISDDDVEYLEDGLISVLDVVKKDEPCFATFKIKTPDNEPEYKSYYSQCEIIDHSFMYHWFSSIEILLNVDSLKRNKIRFDERFGLGTKLKKGEENILIHDCIKKNLKGVYYPIYIVRHPFESSGKRPQSECAKYLFYGALDARLSQKRSLPFYCGHFLKKYRNFAAYNLARLYIKFTKR